MKILMRPVVLGILILGLVTGAFGAGLVTASMGRDVDAMPFSLLNRATDKARRILFQGGGDIPAGPLRIGSIFVPMDGAVVTLPASAERAWLGGGAVTSVGNRVLVVDQDGRTFFAAPGAVPEPAGVTLPDNGIAAYRAASAEPQYAGYQHRFASMRYNDIAFYANARGAGLLVSYTKYYADRACYATVVSRAALRADVAESSALAVSREDWVDIFETEPCLPLKAEYNAIEGHMAGGRMVLDAAGETVFLASGEYHWDGVYGPASLDPDAEASLARDPETDYGKVIAIPLDGGPARALSRGLRNMQGITLDREGRIWTVEHGPRGGDELNVVVPGADYGWPLETYGTTYSGLYWPTAVSVGRHETFAKPRLAWLPSIATSSLTRIDGFHEAWDGDLLVGTLAGRMLVRVRLDGDRVVFAERIDVGARVRDVHQHADGAIVLLVDSGAQQVVFLTPSDGGLGARFVEDFIADSVAGPIRNAVRVAVDGCAQCHAFNPGEHMSAGPSLARAYGGRVGGTAYDRYSAALSRSSDVWTRERLSAYLTDPEAVYPGSVMPNPQISDPRAVEAVVDLLEALATTAE